MIQDFLDYMLMDKHCSELTCVAYHNDLVQYEKFLEESHVLSFEVDSLTARQFIQFLYASGYKRKTITRKIGTIKSFYKFLFRHQKVTQDPWRDLKTPKKDDKLPKSLNEEEVERLLEEASHPTTFEEKRERVILELLYSTGMRVGELVQLQIQDLDLESL